MGVNMNQKLFSKLDNVLVLSDTINPSKRMRRWDSRNQGNVHMTHHRVSEFHRKSCMMSLMQVQVLLRLKQILKGLISSNISM